VVLAALLIVFSATVYAARRSKSRSPLGSETIIQDADGRYIRGWAKPDGSKIRFTDIEGRTVVFDRKKVTVSTLAQLEKEFKKKRREVKTREGDQTSEYVKLFPLAKYQQLYEEVQALADKLIRRNPANPPPEAVQAKQWALKKLRLLEKTQRGVGFSLSAEDIQKIRFALIDPANPPKKLRVAFSKKARDRFLAQMVEEGKFTETDRALFVRKPPGEQVAIVKSYTRDTYQKDIEIHSDPPLISEFRRRVVPLLSRSCATGPCHGDPQNEKFAFQLPMRAPQQLYADFIIMETYPAKAGAMIDHTIPKRSLLLTYALPPKMVPSGLTHPTPIRSTIRSPEDPKYKMLLDWLNSLPREIPDYGITLPKWPVSQEPDKPKLPGKNTPVIKSRERPSGR